jgi:hypothetical protein
MWYGDERRWHHYQHSFPVEDVVTVPWFRPVVFGVGLIYVIAITLINVVAVGYNTIVYSSTDYNGTHGLWYDKFVPSKGANYSHRQCDNALIRVNDCTLLGESSDIRCFHEQRIQLFPLPTD